MNLSFLGFQQPKNWFNVLKNSNLSKRLSPGLFWTALHFLQNEFMTDCTFKFDLSADFHVKMSKKRSFCYCLLSKIKWYATWRPRWELKSPKEADKSNLTVQSVIKSFCKKYKAVQSKPGLSLLLKFEFFKNTEWILRLLKT